MKIHNAAKIAVLNALKKNKKYQAYIARYWFEDELYTSQETPKFPEDEFQEIKSRPSIGICFSGGGTRSAVASLGIMRALKRMGYEGRIKYISSVSGGSWFSTAYTYLPNNVSDMDFFGERLGISEINKTRKLRENTDSSDFLRAASKTPTVPGLLFKYPNPFGANWFRATSKIYLEPFGLYSENTKKYFTWSKESRDRILNKNTFLSEENFNIVEKPRPYFIAGGTVSTQDILEKLVSMFWFLKYPPIWTTPLLTKLGVIAALIRFAPDILSTFDRKLDKMAQAEMTPLYYGVFSENNLSSTGFIESFGINKSYHGLFVDTQSNPPGDGYYLRPIKNVHAMNTLSNIVGATSAFFGIMSLPRKRFRSAKSSLFSSDTSYFPITNPGEKKVKCKIIDGGYIENTGIMPLLRRKVERIIVCNNSSESFSKNIDKKISDSGMDFSNLKYGDLVRCIPTAITYLFDVQRDIDEVNYDDFLQRKTNHVFLNENKDLERMCKGFLENKSAYGVTFHKEKYQVIENINYKTKKYEVEIIWFLLDSSQEWDAEMTSDFISKFDNQEIKDSLKKFPNFETNRTNLSKEEISLLANFTDWCFGRINGPTLQDFFS